MRFYHIALVISLLASGSVVRAQTFSGKARDVADADRRWSIAFHAKDLDQSVAFMTADALVFAPNLPSATGRAAITDMYKNFMAVPGLDFSWHTLHVDVAASGDLAYSDGVYEMSFTGPDGRPILDRGKYLTIWRLDSNGLWHATREIFNSDRPIR